MSGVTGYEASAALTPDEQIASNKYTGDTTRKIVDILAAQIPAWVAPDPKLTEITGGPSALNYVPGAGVVNALAGTTAAVSDALGSLRNAVTGNNTDWKLPGMETMRTMGQHYTNTYQEIQQQIADASGGVLIAPDPKSESDQLLDIGTSTLSMGLPAAGVGVGKGLTRLLPYGTKWLQGMVLPTAADAGKVTAIAAPLAGVSVGAEAALQHYDKQDAAAAAPLPSFSEFAAKQPMLPETTKVAQADEPAKVEAVQPTVPSFNDYLTQGTTPPGPTFQQEGVGDMSVGRALATLGGILGAVALGKAVHGIGAAVTETGRAARFNDPVYAAKAKEYNDAKIRRGGSEISEGTEAPPDAPLPEANRFHQLTNWMNTKALNEHAQMQDAIRMMADPLNAEKLAYQYGQVHNDMAASTKLDNFLKTGYHPETGVQMPSPEQVFKRIGKLDAVEEKTLIDGLSAWDEKDNRARNRQDGATDEKDIRHNYRFQSEYELDQVKDRMMSDPKLAAIANDYWDMGSKTLEIGRRLGFFTQAEANELAAVHPHYVPEVDKTGKILHPFGPRDKTLATGVDQVNSKPWFNMAQHLQELHRQFDLNTNNRNLDQSFRDAQKKYPDSAQFIYDVPGPQISKSFYSSGPFREPVVVIRTADGPRYSRIDNADVHNAMSGDSLKRSHILAEALTIPRRVYQKGTTGTLSLLSGRVSSLINPLYTSVLMAQNAPKGRYGGMVSKLTQQATGYDSGIARGIDMVTNLPGVGYSYGRGVADRMVGRSAEWIGKNADNPINRWLRASVGDATVDGMQQSMERYFQNTVTNRMRGELGLGGQGIPVKSDLPALQIKAEQDARLTSAAHVPSLFYAGKWKIPGTNIATKPFFVKLDKVIEGAMANLSDAGHDYYARLNWNNPRVSKEALAAETRNLTGDPGVRGSSTLLRGATSMIPYLNIAMQGTARLGKSIGDRPLGSAMTMATGLGTMALAEILTHMQSPEHLDYLQNNVGLQQREANVILATSSDPTKGTMVALPQEFRAPYALVLDLMSKAVNLVAMKHDGDVYQGVLHAITDFLGGHITASNEDAIIHGVVDVTNAANLPPWAGQIDQTKLFHGKGIFDKLAGLPDALIESYHSPAGGPATTLPNQVPDGPLDDKNGKVWSKIFSSVFGLSGMALDTTNNTQRYAEQMSSWADAIGQSGHDWLQGFQDKNPQTNILFEHQLRLSVQPPIVERTQRELDWMKKITGARTEPVAEGFTSRDRTALPVPPSKEQKIPTDPVMAQMYFTLGNYYSRMSPQLAEIVDIRKQMGAVQAQGFNVQERRAWMNDRTRVLADKYRFLHDMVEDASAEMSRVAGRPLHVGQYIDWSKGVDQFSD